MASRGAGSRDPWRWIRVSSHHENQRSADRGWQNTRRTGKPPFYLIMFKIMKIKPNSGSVWQKLKSFHSDWVIQTQPWHSMVSKKPLYFLGGGPYSSAHFDGLVQERHNSSVYGVTSFLPGLGSNMFYQIQIQIQIQKFGFFKYKYKYKYFAQLCFKYKYKYKCIDSNTNTNTNTFNQIYLPKLFGSKIGKFFKSPKICSWSVFPNV